MKTATRPAKTDRSRLIERLIDRNRWDEARGIISEELRHDPNCHWLHDRLSLTYYEQGDYKRALECSRKALQLKPDCPLALWDYAGDLDMVGRKRDALDVYTRLLSLAKSVEPNEECWEGVRWTRSLLNDTQYRMAMIYRDLKEWDEAVKHLRRYVNHRDRNTPSIFDLRQARRRLDEWIALANGKC